MTTIQEHDLTGYVCPLSKLKAAEAIDKLSEGEILKLIIGDVESLKSVAQELKSRSIKPAFEQRDDSRFILTITG